MSSNEYLTSFFSARCNIYISRLCYDVSVRLSVTNCIGSWCIPGTQRLRQPAKLKKPSYRSCDPQKTWPPPMEGSSRAMLATARPSCFTCVPLLSLL